MKCHSCGSEIREDSRFCAVCGANLTEVPAPAAEPVVQTPVPEEPAQPQYEYTPPVPQPQEPVAQPWTQPQTPVAQPWVQSQQPQAQAWVPPQGQPGVQYVYTYAQPTTPGGPQIVYVKTKTPGRGFGISSMVLGIIGMVYTFSGISSLNQMALMFQEMAEMGLEYTANDYIATLVVIGVMPLLALIFGINARKKGYKNGVSMSGLIMGIIGLVLLLIEILVLIGNGAL